MRLISNRVQFVNMFDNQGKPKEPFHIGSKTVLNDLGMVTSLNGVTMGNEVELHGLVNLESLVGVELHGVRFKQE